MGVGILFAVLAPRVDAGDAVGKGGRGRDMPRPSWHGRRCHPMYVVPQVKCVHNTQPCVCFGSLASRTSLESPCFRSRGVALLPRNEGCDRAGAASERKTPPPLTKQTPMPMGVARMQFRNLWILHSHSEPSPIPHEASGVDRETVSTAHSQTCRVLRLIDPKEEPCSRQTAGTIDAGSPQDEAARRIPTF